MTEAVPGDPLPAAPAPAPASRRGRSGSSRALGSGYWRLWAASVISNLGDGVGMIAYPWLATTLTRNAVLVAGVGVAQRLPWLLFSLPAGVIVDRVDRRRLMVGSNAVRFALTGLLFAGILGGAVTGGRGLVLLYAAAVLIGVAEVLYDNAAQTILPAIVPADRLEKANGTLWGAEMTMNQFVGPPLGGLLIAGGLALPFGFDAATFGLSAVLIATISGSFRAQTAAPAAPAAHGATAHADPGSTEHATDDGAGVHGSDGSGSPARRGTLRREMREGLAWLWAHRLLRQLALALGVQNLLFAAIGATFVLFAQELLRLDARGFGVLEAAGAVGGVLGSQLGATVSARLGPGRSLGLSLAVPVFALAAIGFSDQPVVIAAMFGVSGFMGLVWNVITVSLRQTIIPDDLLGRVNSVYRMLGWGTMPLGALLGGGLVALAEPLLGRPTALRLPFFVAGGAYALLFLVMAPRLTTAAIAEAKARAAR